MWKKIFHVKIGIGKDESSECDDTLTQYESLHMGHFEKMMSENCAKDSTGKIINSTVVCKTVYKIGLYGVKWS